MRLHKMNTFAEYEHADKKKTTTEKNLTKIQIAILHETAEKSCRVLLSLINQTISR